MLTLKDDLKNRDIKVGAIGHSFGARIVTRAAFSRPLLPLVLETADIPAPVVGSSVKPDFVIGLQSAFSVNRFVEGHEINFFQDLIATGDGFPYENFQDVTDNLILAWSKGDSSVGFAVLASGAQHAGGVRGFNRLNEAQNRHIISSTEWPSGQGNQLSVSELVRCDEIPSKGTVNMVNMSATVHDHNDVIDLDMGRFLWCVVVKKQPIKKHQ